MPKIDYTSLFRRSGSRGLGLAVLLLVGNLGLRAGEPNLPPADFSPAVIEILTTRLAPLLTPENTQAEQAIAIIEQVLSTLRPENAYDLFELSNMRGKLLLNSDRYADAIRSLETVYGLANQYPHFMPNLSERLELTRNLAASYLQVAQTVEGQAKTDNLRKADEYMGAYIENSPFLSSNDYQQYAYILIQQIGDPPNREMIERTEAVLEEGLRLTIAPRYEFYHLLVTLQQMKGDMQQAAEYLELLLAFSDNYTGNAERSANEQIHWQSLAPAYSYLAATLSDDDDSNGAKDERMAETYALRAILTYKRAQARGYLTSPQDYMRLISLYYQLGQIGLAAETMERALNEDLIDATSEQNWGYLAGYYNSMNREDKAIEILRQASSRFPEYGGFDMQLFQSYYATNRLAEAYDAAVSAATKGVPGRNGAMWMSAAYCAYELKRYQEAMAAILRAETEEDTRGNGQLPGLKQAIQDQLDAQLRIQEAINRPSAL